MRKTVPKVYLIGYTQLHQPGVDAFFSDIGVPDWNTDTNNGGLRLMETAGRLCYAAWIPGYNKNVTRIREGNAAYLQNIIKQRHGSILEHVTVNLIARDVSRVATHEWVRHRAGTAYSMQSDRYVRHDEMGIWLPAEAEENDEVVAIFEEGARLMEGLYQRFVKTLGLDDDDKDFKYKKFWTSVGRRMLFEGRATNIMWSANLRTVRTVLELRTDPAAEVEIRYIFGQIGAIVTQLFPAIFADYTVEMVDGLPYYRTENTKV